MKGIVFFIFLSWHVKTCFCQAMKSFDADTLKLNKYQLSERFREDWLVDSNGCRNLRSKYVNKLTNNKKLKEINQNEFIKIFGPPNETIDENKFKYYAISLCSEKNINMAFLIFSFKEGTLENCKFIVVTPNSP